MAAGATLAAGRLSVLRRIGEGGMGVVYEAFDDERRTRVALKTLSRLDPSSVYRLKNEFRGLADVSHPNLVRLHELFADGDAWFFTMELVDGPRFDEWVRPSGVLDEARLRAALPQLLSGILAIHAAGKLHRDLKPSNVLVSRDGRVAVLDFGLAVDPDLGGVGQTVADDRVSGTPAYMAPEQAAGQVATAASDFYAVGVMLFEALTGKLPFEGHSGAILSSKQTRDAPRAATVAQGVPGDLDALCSQLMAREPAARPDALALRAQLAALDSGPKGSARSSRPSRSSAPGEGHEPATVVPVLVGRQSELGELQAAFEATLAGKPVVTFLSGESGFGKSALCESFVAQLRAAGRAAVLVGRCYERENVPFKGFDALVDDLSRHLRRLPSHEAAALLPREAFALARVFPVLERVSVVADSPKKHVADPQDLKRRAFEAFGELLGRMRDRSPVVIVLDDVQWLDQDSVRFMRALLIHPEPVPVMVICAHRSEGAEDNEMLQAVRRGAQDNVKLDVRELRLGPLDQDALCVLTSALLPPGVQQRAAAGLAAEAHGSPFFAAVLARAALARGLDGAPPSLREALSLQVSSLPAAARKTLQLLALAGQALPAETVIEAAGSADGHAMLDKLRSEQLVRVSRADSGARLLECYHDKIREEIAAALEPLHVRELALALARALTAHGSGNEELFMRLFNLAGMSELAARHAARAADAAFATLAFRRAAELYTWALEHGRFEPVPTQRLRVQRADALAQAGQAELAAGAYVAAAEQALAADVPDLERAAAEQYLLAGNLERGRALLDRALRHVGHGLASSLAGAVASTVWSRAQLRMRGLAFRARTDHGVEVERELESLNLATHCLVRSDFLRAADFTARACRRALDEGHAVAAARALPWELFMLSSTGASEQRIHAVRDLAASLIEQTGDPKAKGLLIYTNGLHDFLRMGRCPEALVAFEGWAKELDASPDRTSVCDRSWAQFFRSSALWALNRPAEAVAIAEVELEDALSRGDHSIAVGHSEMVCFGHLAADRADHAERIMRQSQTYLRSSEITIQDAFWLTGAIFSASYAGRSQLWWQESVTYRQRYVGSWMGRMMNRGPLASILGAGAAGAALEAVEPIARRALRAEAHQLLRASLRGPQTGINFAPPRALMCCLEADRAGAIAAARASLEVPNTPLTTTIVRRRLGELLANDEGDGLIAEADAELRKGGVVNPERYAHALTPGFALHTD